MTPAPSLATTLRTAYRGKRVLVTGHTGFKGGWLCLWLRELGADVVGYALAPDTTPNFFSAARVRDNCAHHEADIRDRERVQRLIVDTEPHYVFHLAAQPLVRASYEAPLDTITTNIVGTAHVLEGLRSLAKPCSVVIVTSDKCYENREWVHGYREDDALGGHDVYSMSKGAAELISSSYRRSFFPPAKLADHGIAIATARAGNVVGGGDWARDRIVPDAIYALSKNEPVKVRNPNAVRPWQHVLEPLSGYLLLGAKLAEGTPDERARYAEAWNFGPHPEAAVPVSTLMDLLVQAWGAGSWVHEAPKHAPHEAGLLRLAIDKAVSRLGWSPRWDLQTTLAATARWYKRYHAGAPPHEMQALVREQIGQYLGADKGRGSV